MTENQKKLESMKDSEYLACRVVYDIATSNLLEDEKKLLAINDILDMVKDESYKPNKKIKGIKVTDKENTVSSLFFFNDSRLGEDFWYNISMIIYDNLW